MFFVLPFFSYFDFMWFGNCSRFFVAAVPLSGNPNVSQVDRIRFCHRVSEKAHENWSWKVLAGRLIWENIKTLQDGSLVSRLTDSFTSSIFYSLSRFIINNYRNILILCFYVSMTIFFSLFFFPILSMHKYYNSLLPHFLLAPQWLYFSSRLSFKTLTIMCFTVFTFH